MNCTPNSLMEAAKCFRCIAPGHMPQVITYLMCQWANNNIFTPCSDPQVDLWLSNMALDPAAILPSASVIHAVCEFVKDLRIDGLFDQMLVVNPVIPPGPSNLVAMTYPLIYQGGPIPFGNVGFVDADLNVDGLVGNNFNFLDTGFDPSVTFPDTSSGAISFYQTGLSGGMAPIQEIDSGVFESVAAGFVFSALTVNTIQSFCWDALINDVRAEQLAFYSMDRTAFNLITLYYGTGSIPVTLIDSNATDETLSSLPIGSVYWFALDDTGAGTVYQSSKRFSFFAIHYGLTKNETQLLFDAVQRMRIAFGGGFVI
jgi:hypothetical protein